MISFWEINLNKRQHCIPSQIKHMKPFYKFQKDTAHIFIERNSNLTNIPSRYPYNRKMMLRV